MATEPGWRQFEKLIADIQTQLVPDGEVEHDVKIEGKSGALRQCDVVVRHKIGLCPILVVFECKDNTKPVDVGMVDAFVGKLDDVAASKGVLVSTSGFQSGARRRAAKANILLLSHREATDADWKALLGEHSWITLDMRGFEDTHAMARLESGTHRRLAPHEQLVLAGQQITVQEFVNDCHDQVPLIRSIGSMQWDIPLDSRDVFLLGCEGLGPLLSVIVTSNFVVRRYAVNLVVASGDVLENPETGKHELTRLTTGAISWREELERQEGIVLSQAEYEETHGDASPLQYIFNPNKTKKYISLVITQKG